MIFRNNKIIRICFKKKLYLIAFSEFKKLVKQAYIAQQNGHMEVCGLVCIDTKGMLKLFFFKNRSNKPYNYQINTIDIALFKRRMKPSYKILGSFHSHPISEAYPGRGDIENGFYNNFELIYDVCGVDLKMWYRFKKNSEVMIHEVPLVIKNDIHLP